MKNHLRNYAASAFLLLPATAAMLAAPSAVMAQPATPDVGALTVTANAGLRPGSRLDFRLTGTPHTKASLRILRENINLREASPGVFVGSYTITQSARIDRNTELRATLRHGNRQATANFAIADTLVAVVVPPPRIAVFRMAPLDRIQPGAVLRFAIEGTPGGTAIVDLPGVRDDFALRELRPGYYEGAYTLRRDDRFHPDRPIVASLRNGEQVVTASLARNGNGNGWNNRWNNDNSGNAGPRGPGNDTSTSGRGDTRPPTLTFLVPEDGSTVPAGSSVHVAATFEDFGGSGVVPRSVQVLVSGRDVTQQTEVGLTSLSYWGVLPPGRHTVDVNARDAQGNAMRKTWSFNVTR